MKVSESDIERAVELIMEKIDGHTFASSEVRRQVSIDFYRQISLQCSSRAQLIRSEMEEDGG